MGIGLELQFAITAGLFQAVNEMVITALLFIGFGALAYVTNESDTRKLGGLIAYHPKVGIMDFTWRICNGWSSFVKWVPK